MSVKRKATDSNSPTTPPSTSTALVVKKAKTDKDGALTLSSSTDLVAGDVNESRTSKLQAPIMLLTGHQADVNTAKFSPDGQSLASASADKQIFLWEVYGECVNYQVLKGHKNVVLELLWSTDSTHLFSASADKTAGVWDCTRAKRIRRLAEHTSYVSSICPARRSTSKCVTCSDDGTAKLWDLTQRSSVITLPHQYPVTAVAFDDAGDHVFTGGIDNLIHCWDIRKPNTEIFRLLGHRDSITCLRLDPYGSYLLSNGMDNELRIWDIRPFAPIQRCTKYFTGAHHNFEKTLLKCNWAPDGSMVGSGSADRMVYIWDTTTREIKYKLPGHAGTVNEVDFHPLEPIIASCGSDNKIYLGEIAKYH